MNIQIEFIQIDQTKSAFPRNAEKHFCLYEAKSCNKKSPMNTGTKQVIILA